jgi:hypothetical protein
MYQFLQDAAFLPSNIASVAMLWGIYFSMAQRRGWSAVCFGVAGLFHLNYALVAPLLWLALKVESRWWDGRRLTLGEGLGAAAMIELCLMNIIPALVVTAHRSGAMPLDEFVSLYVRLRHPHHYDPSAWPTALWVSFLLPIPLAWWAWRTAAREEWREPELAATREAARTVEILLLLLLTALLTAGIWYVSETAVQLSLWRFSIFVKLLTCVGVAMWVEQQLPRWRPVLATAAASIGMAMIAVCVVRGPYFGAFRIAEDPPSYLAACDWIREHTPPDAVFLVPPDEQEFRLRARRAIVVNYKAVPQLSRELGVWRDRLREVLQMRDLRNLPRPFEKTLAAIHERYESLPPEHYADAARRYGARYVLVGHRLPDDWEPRRIDLDGNTSWFLYDLSR